MTSSGSMAILHGCDWREINNALVRILLTRPRLKSFHDIPKPEQLQANIVERRLFLNRPAVDRGPWLGAAIDQGEARAKTA